MRATQDWSQHRWEQIGQHMLERVSVETHYTNRCRPLMMDLVDMLVQSGMVQQPEIEIIDSEGFKFFVCVNTCANSRSKLLLSKSSQTIPRPPENVRNNLNK